MVFVPISLLLSVPNFNSPSAALAFFLTSSPIHQHSVFNFDLMKVNPSKKPEEVIFDWTQGKAGENPKTNKNPCHSFVEQAQRPDFELT